ncbi:MAG: polysaccharide biosynthesis C-terminal domain-containing protein, partial [Flavobacteriales bacterium]
TQSGEVFGLLMICFVFISTTYIFGTLLTANGNLKTLNKIAFVGVILNIVLNLILIPMYQAYGAAIASVITQGLTALAQVWLCKSYFKLKINFELFSKIVLFTFIMVTTGYVLKTVYVNEIEWHYAALIMLGSGSLNLFLFKIIEFKNIRKLLLER